MKTDVPLLISTEIYEDVLINNYSTLERWYFS